MLIFCKAGKDRTGLLAALILAAAGCNDERILRDYIRYVWGKDRTGLLAALILAAAGCTDEQILKDCIRVIIRAISMVTSDGDPACIDGGQY